MDLNPVRDFVKPLYQDLDGISRLGEIDRTGRIARALYSPADETNVRHFELLVLLHGLERWFSKGGNFSRAALALHGSVSEGELSSARAAIRRLDAPVSDAEKAVAAARLIERSGAHGLARRFVEARREGSSPEDVARSITASSDEVPSWVEGKGRRVLLERLQRRREICEVIVRELEE